MQSPVTISLSSDEVQQNLHHIHVRRPYPEVWVPTVRLANKRRHKTLNTLTLYYVIATILREKSDHILGMFYNIHRIQIAMFQTFALDA